MVNKIEVTYVIFDIAIVLAGGTYSFASVHPLDPLVISAMTVSTLSLVCLCVPQRKKKIAIAATAFLKTMMLIWGLKSGLSSSCEDCPWDITAVLVTAMAAILYGTSMILSIVHLVKLILCTGHGDINEEG